MDGVTENFNKYFQYLMFVIPLSSKAPQQQRLIGSLCLDY